MCCLRCKCCCMCHVRCLGCIWLWLVWPSWFGWPGRAVTRGSELPCAARGGSTLPSVALGCSRLLWDALGCLRLLCDVLGCFRFFWAGLGCSGLAWATLAGLVIFNSLTDLFDLACLTTLTVVVWLAACLTRLDGLAACVPFECTSQNRVASASIRLLRECLLIDSVSNFNECLSVRF